MDRDYWSIDSILAENQKVTCKFTTEIPDMGHLAGSNGQDIKLNQKIALPIWLAFIILYSNWGEMTIPSPFGARVRNALDAEPKSVRLSALVGQGGMWYGFGKTMMDWFEEEEAREISKLLRETFRNRLVEVINQAQHFAAIGSSAGGQSGDSAQSFREGLDVTERELFAMAQESARSTKKWYEGTDKSRR